MRTDESRGQNFNNQRDRCKTESHLARIGIYTVGDMAEHYPREYHAYDTPVSIENTEYDNRRQSGYRVIFSETPKLLKRGRTPIVSVMLHAGNASVQVVWYHSLMYGSS